MTSINDLFEILAHDIRRRIIKLVYERIEVSYTEILNTLGVSDGLLNFHLRKMSGVLEKTDRGTYILTSRGKQLYKLITEVEDRQFEREYRLDMDIILRRVLAFTIDGLIFLTFTGLLFDPVMWSILIDVASHLPAVLELHPWIFHLDHTETVGNLISRVAGIYAHIFYAVYIFLTLLEAYKGQTPGKYLLGIRVIKKGGLKLGIIESGIRNAGKIFLLPFDLMIGTIFFRNRGFIRFFDYYTDSIVERVV